MITQFLSSIVSGVGRLIMQWSAFYGALFGSIFGLLVVFMLFTTGLSSIEYSYHWLMGNRMYDFWMWDRKADVMNGVNVSEAHVYYGGNSGDQIMASFKVENTLPYAVRNIMLTCDVYDIGDDTIRSMSFASSTIAANSTTFVSAKSAEGLHYIGIFDDLGNCKQKTGGQQEDSWRKPIRGLERRW